MTAAVTAAAIPPVAWVPLILEACQLCPNSWPFGSEARMWTWARRWLVAGRGGGADVPAVSAQELPGARWAPAGVAWGGLPQFS